MRKILISLAFTAALTCGSLVRLSRAQLPLAPLSPDAPIDTVLDALDQRGNALKDFTAQVRLTEADPAIGTDSSRLGQISFQKKADGDARMHVVLDQKVTNKTAVPDKLEYLLDNGWLFDRTYKRKIEVDRQLVQPGQKVELLKLGKGPFPLPIGQSKQDVHDNFEVTKSPLAKGEPAGTIHVTLKPRAGTELKKRFDSIDVWVDSQKQMPVRIKTVAPGGTDARTTDLTDLKVNVPGGLPDAAFKLPDINKAQWNLTTEPLPSPPANH